MLRHLAVIVALAVLACGTATAEPTRPSDDDLVLATVPAGEAAAAPDLRQAEADLSRDSKNLTLALRLARLAIEQGRTWSDPRRYGEAQAALSPWWSTAHPPEEVLILRAVIEQALHDFSAALSDLGAVLQSPPRNGQPRLTRAFVRMVVGDITGAADDCLRLPLAVGRLTIAACRARVAALSGSGEEAYDRLSRLMAREGGENPAIHRFLLFILADIAEGIGRTEDADRHFTEAAAIGAPDVPLLAAMADDLLDRNRPADVVKLLDGKGEADVLVLRRAIAAKRMRDPLLAQWSAMLNERFAAATAGRVRTHLREEARFRLEVEGDSAAALRLAIENWAIQKEIADARLLLECAIAAGRPESAADVVRHVRATGLIDKRVTPYLSRLGDRIP